MSITNENDVRTQLTREKYFSLRPKPLERWIWQQGLPQAAERVFWIHWEEGMRRGDWCSEMPLSRVARECAVDASTVTRAYQALRRHGLIRREDPGRDPSNPFRQAIAITEVLVPRDLLQNLSRHPNRSKAAVHAQHSVAAKPSPAAVPATARMSRADFKRLMAGLSDAERQEFYLASRDRRTSMRFDSDSSLNPEQRGHLLTVLASISNTAPATPVPDGAPTLPKAKVYVGVRRLSPLEAARVRAGVQGVSPPSEAAEMFRQVLWSIEEGALRRFDVRLALNIALKKLREGAWSRPHRLPPNWLASARAEPCSAA